MTPQEITGIVLMAIVFVGLIGVHFYLKSLKNHHHHH